MVRTLAAALATSTCIVALATPAAAQTREYNIPAGSLKDALDAYVRQSGRQVVYRADEVRSARSPGARGQLSGDAALNALLDGSGFTTRIDGQLIAIVKASGNGSTGAVRSEGGWSQSAAGANENSEILVTGTRVRGGRTASPVISIDADQIRKEGYADLGEVIRSVPQNFSGGQNPGVSSGNISTAGLVNQNVTGGSGLNLRGLGPDATLTLLNGRRLAYGGFVQSVDISAIPVEAVERIEIVPDGASAIYGSDAVGGVGNVILKPDFNGLTIGGRIGSATDGGLATYEYSGTAGTRWSSGGFIAAYQNTSVDPIYARQRKYADFLIDPTTLYPGSHLSSGIISAHQQLGDVVSLHLDALRTRRTQDYSYYIAGINNIHSTTTATFVSPSVQFTLPKDWTISLGGAWGRNDHIQHQTVTNVTTGASTIITNDLFRNDSRTYEAGAEGPLFALPGGDARLAVGGGYRTTELEQFNRTTETVTFEGKEHSKFAYAEINLPLIGPQSNIAAIRRLTLTAAIRGEDYDSFGSIATPKIGLIYEPGTDFTVKLSWGKSFKAPTLFQQYQTRYAYLFPATTAGGTGYPATATVLIPYGGNPDLKPERAQTWSGSLLFHPAAIRSLQIELTGFYVDYTDRVIQPIANTYQALSNPIYSQFIDYYPSAEKQSEIISSSDGFYNFSGANYDPNNVISIVNYPYINVARQKIKGVDLSGTYRTGFGAGHLTVRGSISLLDSKQKTSAAQDSFDLAGTLFNPPKATGRIGVVWDRDGFSASTFVNYKGGVWDTVQHEKTSSFTTVDLTLRYATGESSSVLSGLDFVLSVQNLLNQAPPIYTPATNAAYAVPYDSTNYSAIGRFVSLSISKHF